MFSYSYLFKIYLRIVVLSSFVFFPKGVCANSPVGTGSSRVLDPFKFSASDIYSASFDDLQKYPPSIIAAKLEELTARYTTSKKEYDRVLKFNQLMCDRLNTLNTKCPINEHIMTENALNQWLCKQDAAKTSDPISIRIQISGVDDSTYFRLVANYAFASNPVGPSGGKVTFTRIDENQIYESPTFKDLTSLSLVAVEDKSTLVNGVITNRTSFPNGVIIKILVNGISLLDDYSLVNPSDSSITSEKRVNPVGILTMGQKPNCVVSLDDLQNMQKQAELMVQ